VKFWTMDSTGLSFKTPLKKFGGAFPKKF